MGKVSKSQAKRKAGSQKVDLSKIRLSSYWNTTEIENWSITWFDRFMVSNVSDITKSTAHERLKL
jgi:hypothetical protein